MPDPELFTAQSSAGLIGAAVRRTTRVDDGDGWCIVVPRAHLKRDVTDALAARSEGSAWIGTRVLSLKELVDHYARRLEGQPALTRLQVTQIIEALVREVHDEDPEAFRGQVRDGRVSRATLRSLTTLFSELEPFALTAEEVEERLLRGPLSEEVGQRAHEVAEVYRRYLDRLAASSYRGPQEEAVQATERAAHAAPPDGTKRFLFLGLDGSGVASVGIRFWRSLADHPTVEASQLWIVLPDDREASAWAEHGNDRLYRDWSEAGGRRTLVTPHLDPCDRPADLEALSTDPFAYHRPRVPAGGGVRGVRVPDTQLEVEWVAADAKRRILEDGLTPADVAIVDRRMDTRSREFERELERLGLPAVASRTEAVAGVPAVRSLLSLFGVVANGWGVTDVVAVAESPYLPLGLNPTLLARVGGRSTAPESPDDWIDRIRTYANAIAREQGPDDEGGGAGARALADRFGGFADRLLELTDGGGPMLPSEWVEALVRAVEQWGIEGRIYSSSERIDRRERGRIARADLDGVNALLEAADEWLQGREVAGLEEEPMSANDWMASLESIAGETEIRASTYPRQAVQLLTPRQAALRSWKVVYVVGLADGRFPARRETGEHTLTDEERRALRLPTTESRQARERLLFHLTAAAANEQLTLVAPAADERGKALVTSPFLSCLSLRIKGFSIEQITARSMVPGSAEQVRSERDVHLLASGRYRELADVADGDPSALREGVRRDPIVGAWLAEPPARRALRAWRVERTRADLDRFLRLHPEGRPRPPRAAFAGLLEPDDVPDAIASPDLTLSPSEAETYGNCHFRFFGTRVLGLWAGPHQAEDHNEAAAFGSLQHAILEELYRSLRTQDALPPGSEADIHRALDELEGVARRAVTEHLASTHRRLWDLDLDFVMDVLKQFVRRDLNRMLQARRGPESSLLRTEIVELEAYADSGDERFEVRGVPFRLRGRLDRVEAIRDDRLPDAAQGWLVVRDYKSSRSRWSPRWKDYEQGKVLQLPLYAAIAERHYGARVFGVGELRTSLAEDPELIAVRDLLPTADGVDLVEPPEAPNPVARARDRALEVVAERVEGMRDGHFAPQPDRSCFGCHLADVCRASKLAQPAKMRRRAHMPVPVEAEAYEAAAATPDESGDDAGDP